jgi:hypothetical protein
LSTLKQPGEAQRGGDTSTNSQYYLWASHVNGPPWKWILYLSQAFRRLQLQPTPYFKLMRDPEPALLRWTTPEFPTPRNQERC